MIAHLLLFLLGLIVVSLSPRVSGEVPSEGGDSASLRSRVSSADDAEVNMQSLGPLTHRSWLMEVLTPLRKLVPYCVCECFIIPAHYGDHIWPDRTQSSRWGTRTIFFVINRVHRRGRLSKKNCGCTAAVKWDMDVRRLRCLLSSTLCTPPPLSSLSYFFILYTINVCARSSWAWFLNEGWSCEFTMEALVCFEDQLLILTHLFQGCLQLHASSIFRRG